MTDNNELILNALLNSGSLHAPELSAEFLKKAFEIEVQFQFEKDDIQALKHLQILIDGQLGETEKIGKT